MKKFALFLFVFFAMAASAHGQTAAVTWATTHQQVDGFGGEDWNSFQAPTQAQANTFFSPTSGIGLSIIRSGNYACPTGASATCAVSLSNVPDIGALQKATALGATVDLNIQSPPGSMKCGGLFDQGPLCSNNGGTNPNACLETSNYSNYANFTVQWIQLLEANSVPVSLVNIANEADSPSPSSSSLGACYWTAAGFDAYIPILGAALNAAGLSSVKIMLPNSGFWFGGSSGDQFSTCLGDSNCNKYVGYVAMQDYGSAGAPDGFGTGYCCSTYTTPPSITIPYHVWESEVNGGATYQSGPGLWTWDASMSDALVWARNIRDALVIGNVSGWEYWQLADCCPGESGAPFNDGLMQGNLTTASARMYVVGNYSKFIRPGWVRIDTPTSLQSGVNISAFRSTSTGQFAIVAINANGSSASQAFSLNGFPAVSSVTPYVTTSASSGLVQGSSIAVSGSAFTATLAASSVTTFTGTASGSSTIYLSQSGGTFSGGPAGSVCNGKGTTAITGSLYSGATAGETLVLCGGSTTTWSFSTSGTSASPITILMDVGAHLSPTNCGTGICYNVTGNYVVWSGGSTPCGPGTSCSSTEAASPIGYPSGTTGIVEQTLAGTPGSTCAAGPCTFPTNTLVAVTSASMSSTTATFTTATLPKGCGNGTCSFSLLFAGFTPSTWNVEWTPKTYTGSGPYTITAVAVNGASGLATPSTLGTYQNASTNQLIWVSGQHDTVQNIIIRNCYRHTLYGDAVGGGGDFPAIDSPVPYFTFQDSTIHDCGTGLLFNASGPTTSNEQIARNFIWNINWGIANGGTGLNCSDINSNWSVHDNTIGPVANWDDINDLNHHDEFFLFADSNYTGCFQHFRTYNNHFQGPLGINSTAMGYFSGGLYRDWIAFNNLFDNYGQSTGPDDALVTQSSSDCPSGDSCSSTPSEALRNNVLNTATQWYNNTFWGGGPTVAPGNQGCIGQSTQYTFVNNVSGGCNQANYAQYYLQPYDVDYNVYGDVTSSKVFATDCCGFSTTLSAWQTLLAANLYSGGTANPETHSFLTVSGSLDLGTNLVPQPGSPVLSNAALNLTSLCNLDVTQGAWLNDMQYLCLDTSAGGTRTPTARSPSAPWTPGAYNGANSVLALSPNPATFGSVNVGSTSSTQTVTLTNGTTASVTLSTPYYTIANSDFVNNLTGTCTNGMVLAVNATCTVILTMTPSVNGTDTGTLQVNAATASVSNSLTGTGLGGVGALSPTSLTFASQNVGSTSPSQNVTFTNNGPGKLTIASVTVTGNFAQTTTCSIGTAMAVNSSCAFTVTFTPQSLGTLTGSIVIGTNGSNSPNTETLSGTGIGVIPTTAISNGEMIQGSEVIQ